MARVFASEAEIGAGASPMFAVRRDPSSADTILRKEMREFVSERAIDFVGAEFLERGIERHERGTKISAADRRAHLRVPFHAHARGEIRRAVLAQQRGAARDQTVE